MSAEGPIKVTNTSEIAICTCIQSNHWPFFDSTHHTTGGGPDGPEIVRLNKKKTYYLCGCFRTKNRPFCDGSHEKIKQL